MHVQNLAVGLKQEPVPLILCAEVYYLKLESAEGKSLELKEADKPLGYKAAAHTLDHINLTQQTDEEIIRQVEEDRKSLSELMGYEVVGMAYPCGGVNNDDRVAEVIKNNTGVKYCRTTTDTDSFDLQDNLYRFNPNVYHVHFDRMMDMGRQFAQLKPDKPQIYYVWGHSYELDFGEDNWNKMEEFCKLISGHDDIFYGTNAEVLL